MLYRYLLRPLLYCLPAETAHHMAIATLKLMQWVPFKLAILRRLFKPHPKLAVQALGRVWSSPLGLAAGFDKDAQVFEALHALGFGFVEVGTLTPKAQPGNPKPRLFRLPRDRALINRMGFNNQGIEQALKQLKQRRHAPLGINIGKNKNTPLEHAQKDYIKGAHALAPYADYVVVNVSSPNTPGLRDLQAVDYLRPLLQAVRHTINERVPERHVPLLLKIAPDLSDAELDAIADLAIELKLDGIIATNTTNTRDQLQSPATHVAQCGAGGLSGAPLKARALTVLRQLRARVGNELVLIAVGGIQNAQDVRERLQAGATLVQAYTALVYQGPLWAWRVNRELVAGLS